MFCAHPVRVHDACSIWLEYSLVRGELRTCFRGFPSAKSGAAADSNPQPSPSGIFLRTCAPLSAETVFSLWWEQKRSAAYIERIEGVLWKTYIAFVVIASLSQDTNQ